MSAVLTSSSPELRLLVSLAAWTWPGSGPDGREIAHILITHSPAFVVPGTVDMTATRMRRLADSLGGLGEARDPIPDAGRCLQIVVGQVLLHFPGASRRLRLPTRPDWTELVARTGEAVLLLGLDPLPQSADAARSTLSWTRPWSPIGCCSAAPVFADLLQLPRTDPLRMGGWMRGNCHGDLRTRSPGRLLRPDRGPVHPC
ncbi:hypothetical protein ACGFSB_25245 [Streptomyces sp. NPDC048441]|uniref:hypothetical protein n=1 Tax=Streptomyces sp. NPDC048441 TaxID=3365552 RepID=UPI00371E3269